VPCWRSIQAPIAGECLTPPSDRTDAPGVGAPAQVRKPVGDTTAGRGEVVLAKPRRGTKTQVSDLGLSSVLGQAASLILRHDGTQQPEAARKG
jgi:hypothetical protein